MELSVLIARVAAVVYLSAALGAALSKEEYRRVADDMFKNAALTYLMGFTAVVLGFLIVSYHNTWRMNWTVLVTILGWLALLKGVLIIAFPRFVQSYSRLIFEGKGFRFFPYVSAFLGFLLGYFGFIH